MAVAYGVLDEQALAEFAREQHSRLVLQAP